MPASSEAWVLGLSISHNGAACLLRGDELVVAIQEERLTGRKRARINARDPSLCIAYCLDAAGIGPGDLAAIGYTVQGSAAKPEYDLSANPQLRVARHGTPVYFLPHHRAHAVSAFATSGFDEAAVLVADGIGSPEVDFTGDERRVVVHPEPDAWEYASLYHARGCALDAVAKHTVAEGLWMDFSKGPGLVPFRSLGGIFSAVAKLLFGEPMEAGKVMGLAPFGTARFPVTDFLRFEGERIVFADALLPRFRDGARWPAHEEDYRDLAASAQAALEYALLALARGLRATTGAEALCMAGGVALNGIANERILREAGYRSLHVVPAAEDSGPCLGAAWHARWAMSGRHLPRALRRDAPGRSYAPTEVAEAIEATPGVYAVPCDDPIEHAAALLCEGRILGWFQGGAELGPRALGQRSIVCDPRRADVRQRLNDRVKHREAFRPFAPAVLLEHADAWFDLGAEGLTRESPFMLRVAPFRDAQRSRVPAVVHVDGSGRLQTLTAGDNGPFHALVRAFHRRTGVPLVLNTSFNIMGEPIVETPEDALYCLLSTGLDACVLHDTVVLKTRDPGLLLDLVPTLVARAITLRRSPERGAFSLDPTGGDAQLVFEVATRWGPARHEFTAGALLPLRFIDGRRTVREVLARMRLHAPVFDGEYVRFLCGLRRRGIVALTAPPPRAAGEA